MVGEMWVTLFQESAESLLGKKADEIGNLKEKNMPEFEKVFEKCLFKTVTMRCQAKMETYNDENRLKVICQEVMPLDLKDYNRRMIADIEAMVARM
jgi:replication factor A1